MKKRIMMRIIVLFLTVTVFSGIVPVETSAVHSVSVNGLLQHASTEVNSEPVYKSGMQMPVLAEKEADVVSAAEQSNSESVQQSEPNVGEVTQEPEYPLASRLDLFSFDWKNASDDEINHYMGMTDWKEIGNWLVSMSQEDLESLLERDTVLIQDTLIEEPDAEPVQMLYYEYAMQKYRSAMMMRAAYPEQTSGYWTVNIVKANAFGVPVQTAIITFKISGVDTSVPTTQRQTVTIAKSVTNNWCSIEANLDSENLSTYRAGQDHTIYPHVRANFNFSKPKGYKVNVSYNLSSSFHKIYWRKESVFHTDSMFQQDGTLASERYVYPEVVTCNNISTSSLVSSTYTGQHKVCSIVNMYVHAGIGTTSSEAQGNLVQTITLLPVTYNVNYNGNGYTSGAVSAQNCNYDVSYIAQSNGFQREYTVSYDGNGGEPAVSSQKASYKFKGWGCNQKSNVNYAAGATYKNLTAESNGTVTMYALWNPVSIKLPSAVRSGYTFDGWNVGAAGASYTPTANITAIAKWKPNTYKIKFQSGGGTEYPEMTATYDQSIVLPVPKKPGYIFNGWSGTSGIYNGTVKNLSAENGATVTLVADWSAATNTPYTLRCYKQPNPNVTDKDDYVLFERKNKDAIDGEYVKYGMTDSTVSVSPPQVKGYEIPPAQSVRIKGDGSTVVEFYYNLEKESVTVPSIDTSDEQLDEQLDEIAKRIAAGLSFSLDVDGVEYEIAQTKDGTLGICFISTKAEKIVIPDVIKIGDKVYRITEIQAGAFKGNKSVKKVELSVNISKIGKSAFEGCTSLKEVVLRDGLVTIGDKAFSGCTALRSIKLPDSVQVIGNYAFQNCKALKKITLNKGLLKIGKKSFYSCNSLKKLTLPDTVLQVGSYAFAKCTALAKVKFAAGSRLLTVGTGVFSECRALKKIKLPSKLTNISSKAFYRCRKLASVTGAGAVTTIGSRAFMGCSALKKITIPSKVQSIGKKAFYQCKVLRKVTIKTKALTKVGSKAFKKCKKGIIFVVPKEKKTSYAKLLRGKY